MDNKNNLINECNYELTKNLGTRKGSRRGNTGNRLELLVLVHLHHVP
ncbi:hypothetical protein ACFW04_001012 [Cataglyphis niger]